MQDFDRVLALLDRLSFNSLKQMAEAAGISPQNIYDIKSGKCNISKDVAIALQSLDKEISLEWLLSGDGEMLKSEQSAVKEYLNTPGVPYYAVDFLGGFDPVFNNQTSTPDGYISFPHIQGAQYWVDISGKSMSPLIDPGDVIALKQIEDWPNNILYGEVYALVTEQYRTVKRIRKSGIAGHIRLVPENPDYDPQDIPATSVIAIFQVLGCAKKVF